jgi:hypothetical protein
MRHFIIAAFAATTLFSPSDARDLFATTSPWDVLATVSNGDHTKSTDASPTQVFVQCLTCADLATALASAGDDISLPLPSYDGTISRFTLKRTTDVVIAKALQTEFPDAQTYFGRNNNGVTIELDCTSAGGVRVQYHGAQGELSYLDRVRADDADLSFASSDVRKAVNIGIPVFRVYRRVAGQRASDPLASHDFKCSTTTKSVLHHSETMMRSLQDGLDSTAIDAEESCLWSNDGFCDPLQNSERCGWDGGDCCARPVDTRFCLERYGGDINSTECSCLDPNYSSEPDASGCIASFIGDGVCDSNNNNNILCGDGDDGQDCCGIFADKDECEGDDCACQTDAEFNAFPGHTYRIAIGTSKNFSAVTGDTVESVMSEVLTAVNRVSGIYKRSLNIGLQLVGNTAELFEFETDAETSFDKPNAISNATAIFASKLGGLDGFDIGHVVSVTSPEDFSLVLILDHWRDLASERNKPQHQLELTTPHIYINTINYT